MTGEKEKPATAAIVISADKQFNYTTQPVEIKNALGIPVALLSEYSIFQNEQLYFKLYKTDEGNWFELPDTIPSSYTALVNTIKIAIDTKL